MPKKLAPYLDIILFVVALFGANAVWKLCVQGDESLNSVWLFGRYDITAPFAFLAEHTARMVAILLEWLRPTVHYIPPYELRFDSGFATRIVWSCTPVKQSFIWMMIILVARGSWWRKLWYIPVGWLAAEVFNILRIATISLLCEFHPAMFPLWHEYVFKYLFYGMLFLLWVLWTERLSKHD